jgi:hypothetical protein
MNTSVPRGFARKALAPLLLLAAVAGSAFASEGGLRHGVLMRGQVLENDAGALVVCIGKQDGAQVGQVLDVVRHVRVPGASKAGPRFRQQDVGKVEITAVVDEHYATAKAVKGAPQVNDTVQLVRP